MKEEKITAPAPDEYRLLDSGALYRLEMVGGVRLVRPCLQAVWPRRLAAAEWTSADAVFERDSSGSGQWDYKRRLEPQWKMRHGGLTWIIKPTSFGHLGIFPEQLDNWHWLTRVAMNAGTSLKALNLFGYTGGSTAALAAAGAEVTHVDASKGTVNWARDIAQLNNMDRSIRWIVEDAMKFAHRELKRGNRYDVVVLDPPSFGRGPSGQYWKIESDLFDLLDVCRQLSAQSRHAFLLLSCHSPGFTPLVLENLVTAAYGTAGKVQSGEMIVPEAAGQRSLPAGVYARWSKTVN